MERKVLRFRSVLPGLPGIDMVDSRRIDVHDKNDVMYRFIYYYHINTDLFVSYRSKK